MRGYDELIEENGPAIMQYLMDPKFRSFMEKCLSKGIGPEYLLRFFRRKGAENMVLIRAVEVYLECTGRIERQWR